MVSEVDLNFLMLLPKLTSLEMSQRTIVSAVEFLINFPEQIRNTPLTHSFMRELATIQQ